MLCLVAQNSSLLSGLTVEYCDVCIDPQGILHRPDISRSTVNCSGGRHLGGGSENQGFSFHSGYIGQYLIILTVLSADWRPTCQRPFLTTYTQADTTSLLLWARQHSTSLPQVKWDWTDGQGIMHKLPAKGGSLITLETISHEMQVLDVKVCRPCSVSDNLCWILRSLCHVFPSHALGFKLWLLTALLKVFKIA